jgi:hypothetical protein
MEFGSGTKYKTTVANKVLALKGLMKIGSTFVILFIFGTSIGFTSLDCPYNTNTRTVRLSKNYPHPVHNLED